MTNSNVYESTMNIFLVRDLPLHISVKKMNSWLKKAQVIQVFPHTDLNYI